MTKRYAWIATIIGLTLFVFVKIGVSVITRSGREADRTAPTGAEKAVSLLSPTAHHLYLSKFWGNSVDLYAPSGQFIKQFVSPGSGGLAWPSALTFGPDGHLYVLSLDHSTSPTTYSVKVYDGKTGEYLRDFVTGLVAPVGKTSSLPSTSDSSDTSDTSGTGSSFTHEMFQAAWENVKAELGAQWAGPPGILFDDLGNFYAAEAWADRVTKFDSHGTILQRYTSLISTPKGLALRENGDILVANSDGAYQNTITEINTQTGEARVFATGFAMPQGIAVGSDGLFYIANRSAEKFDLIQAVGGSGGSATTFVPHDDRVDGASQPAFLDGDLFVAHPTKSLILRYDGKTGAFVSSFSAFGVASMTVGP